jgi:hypothetical protein
MTLKSAPARKACGTGKAPGNDHALRVVADLSTKSFTPELIYIRIAGNKTYGSTALN